MLTLLSVDEILLPRCASRSTNFRGLSLNEEMATCLLKHMICFIWVYIETNASCCLLQAMQQTFGLCKYICKKCQIICIIDSRLYNFAENGTCLGAVISKLIMQVIVSEFNPHKIQYYCHLEPKKAKLKYQDDFIDRNCTEKKMFSFYQKSFLW